MFSSNVRLFNLCIWYTQKKQRNFGWKFLISSVRQMIRKKAGAILLNPMLLICYPNLYQNINSHLLPLHISYRRSGEKLLKYQANSSSVIPSLILVHDSSVLKSIQIWYWSLLGFNLMEPSRYHGFPPVFWPHIVRLFGWDLCVLFCRRELGRVSNFK